MAWKINMEGLLNTLEAARIKNLNRVKNIPVKVQKSSPPLFNEKELYGVIPADSRHPFDVRSLSE